MIKPLDPATLNKVLKYRETQPRNLLSRVFRALAVRAARKEDEISQVRQVMAGILEEGRKCGPAEIRRQLESLADKNGYRHPVKHLFPALNSREAQDVLTQYKVMGFETAGIRGDRLSTFNPPLIRNIT